MSEPRAVVIVTLKSQQRIESPDQMSREEAEEVVSRIARARDEGEPINLPWLTAQAHEVSAAHIEKRYPPSLPKASGRSWMDREM